MGSGSRAIQENVAVIPPFYRAVLADPDAAYVFLAGTEREPRLRSRLLAAGYRRLRTGDFIVYVRPRAA